MRSRKFLLPPLALGLALALVAGTDGKAPRAAAQTRPSGDGAPGPFDQDAAAEAGRQSEDGAGPAAAGPAVAAASNGPGSVMVARVYATQYAPNTPGSVEVAVPDKCAKFAGLRQPSVLASFGCPAAYSLDMDYRVIVLRDNGQYGIFPVKDVGPWNIDDNYWDFGPGAPRPRRIAENLPPGLPEAQAAFQSDYNNTANCKNLDMSPSGRTDGADQFGRCVLNPAGIDLSVNAAASLGIGHLQNEWVTVAFLWSYLRSNVVSVNSGQLLDVAGVSAENGAHIIQYPATGVGNQQFRFVPVSDDTYAIMSVYSGKVLDVGGFSTGDGAPIIQYTWHGGANQRWRVEPVGEGQFRIVSVHSGKVLDIGGASTAPGAPLIQYTWHGGANQRWGLSVVGTG